MSSGLQLTYSDYMADLGYYLGYGSDATQWTSDQTAQLNRIMFSGYSQWLYPSPADLGGVRVSWSFTKPIGQFTLLAPVSGTVDSNTTTTLTDTGAFTGLSLTGSVVSITASTTTYYFQIVSNTADTLTWNSSGAFGGTITGSVAGSSYTVAKVDYTLPADFESLAGKLFYSPNATVWMPIDVVSEQQILQLRSTNWAVSGIPLYAAIAPKNSDSSAEQGAVVMIWPACQTNYTLQYRYTAKAVPLSGTYPYPLGGAAYSQAIKASCRDVAEREVFEVEGPMHKDWLVKLAGAWAKDGQRGPDTMGEVKDNFDARYQVGPRGPYWPWFGTFEIQGVPNT